MAEFVTIAAMIGVPDFHQKAIALGFQQLTQNG
jgi:hypothetical protein